MVSTGNPTPPLLDFVQSQSELVPRTRQGQDASGSRQSRRPSQETVQEPVPGRGATAGSKAGLIPAPRGQQVTCASVCVKAHTGTPLCPKTCTGTSLRGQDTQRGFSLLQKAKSTNLGSGATQRLPRELPAASTHPATRAVPVRVRALP